jgi:acyl-CoA dehydrogenase
VANIKTTARRDGDHFVVNGSKTFISGGLGANWISTAVRTGGEGAAGISMLLIPTDLKGVARTSLDKKQGWWCSDTATIYFDDVRVPASNLIGPEGMGFAVIMNNFNSERLGMIVNMEACARCCLNEAVNWAKERVTFGQPLSKHQVIRHKITAMKQRINATQAYTHHITREIMEGKSNFADLALLKVQASETMEFCAREASQILGGASYLRGSKVERF